MSAPPVSPLLTPLQIGSLTVAGRLFKSATSETRSSQDGFVTDDLLEFYEPMVRAGTPLIVTGNLFVSLQGKSAERQAGIDADDKKPGLREWVQLTHGGFVGAHGPWLGDDYPTLLKINGTDMLPLRRGATTAELVRIAKVMQDEGIDAVEISRGHYESWPATVLGHYKGFIKAEVTEGAAAKLPRYRRMAMLTFAPLIERAAERLAPGSEGFNLPQAEQFTAQLDIPVICVGGFHTKAGMEAAITTGRCDAVSAARGFIANPFLFQHIQTPPREAPVCGYCNGCIARHGGKPIDCYSDDIRARKELMLLTNNAKHSMTVIQTSPEDTQ